MEQPCFHLPDSAGETHELADEPVALSGKSLAILLKFFDDSILYLQAILKHLYLDILKEPERMASEIETTNKNKNGYELAWQIVETGNYLNLIAEFKTKIKKE